MGQLGWLWGCSGISCLHAGARIELRGNRILKSQRGPPLLCLRPVELYAPIEMASDPFLAWQR